MKNNSVEIGKGQAAVEVLFLSAVQVKLSVCKDKLFKASLITFDSFREHEEEFLNCFGILNAKLSHVDMKFDKAVVWSAVNNAFEVL
jgi:hypothetical protein